MGEKPKGAGIHCGVDLDKRFMNTSLDPEHPTTSCPFPGLAVKHLLVSMHVYEEMHIMLRWLERFPPNHKSREISKFPRKCLCKYLSLPCQWGQGPEDPVMGQQPAADNSSLLPK